MRKYSLIAILLSSALLIGCDNTEDYVKCGIAAQQLGKSQARAEISIKFKEYSKENHIQKNSREMMEIGEKAREELGLLDQKSLLQLFKIIKTYNSSTCTNLHEQQELPPPSILYYITYPFI